MKDIYLDMIVELMRRSR